MLKKTNTERPEDCISYSQDRHGVVEIKVMSSGEHHSRKRPRGWSWLKNTAYYHVGRPQGQRMHHTDHPGHGNWGTG